MQIQELEEICKNPNDRKKYSWSDYYSLGICIKEYAKFPKFLNLEVYTDHGPAIRESLLPIDLNNHYRVSLLQNTIRIKSFKKIGKPAYCTGSPFVHYRKKRNIQIKKDAKGTVCFPYHSTKYFKASFDIDDFLLKLNNLAETFKPITICLHHCDVEDGKHLEYIEKGFNVVSAGHKFDKKFVTRFYEILSGHKYATSNGYGSHVPYSVEMGLPFFYFDSGIKIKNIGDEDFNLKEGSLDEFAHTDREMNKYEEAKLLFNEVRTEISEEQKAFAEEVLGIHDAISPKKLNRILWREFLTNLHNILGSYLKSIHMRNIQFAKQIVKKIKHVAEIKKNI